MYDTESVSSVEDDLEVKNLFLNSAAISEVETDKPLSPILKSALNRKCFGRKSRNRIQLSKKFEKEKCTETCIEKEIQEFNEKSFTLIETENLVECLERLEEIEKNRENAYKHLVNSKRSNLCFKKPTLPAPKTPKRLKTAVFSPVPLQEPIHIEHNEEPCERLILTLQTPIDLPKSSNFQTATGKYIHIHPEEIENNLKVFECDQNKYSFLKKSQCSQNINSNITTTNNCIVGQYDEITFSQAISGSGITDTQILFAIDHTLGDHVLKTDEFSGFAPIEKATAVDLAAKFQINFNKICRTKHKRQIDDQGPSKRLKIDTDAISNSCSFTSGKNSNFNSDGLSKAMHTFDQKVEFPNFEHMLGQNNSCIIDTKFGGFSNAAGKKILISTDSLSKAKSLFDNIDSEINTNFTSETRVNISSASQKNNTSVLSKNDQKACSSIKDKLKYFDNLIGADEDISEILDNNKNHFASVSSTTFGGFSNAAGKQILVSADSLSKVKSLFDNIDNDLNFNDTDLKETQEAKVIGDKKRKLQRFSNITNISLPNSDPIEGPKMNSNSSSSTSLLTKNYQKTNNSAKQDLKQFDHLVEDDLSKPTKSELDETTSKNLTIGNYKNSFSSVSVTNNNSFGGFCKASGKELIVTSNALSKAKALFEDIANDTNLNLIRAVKPLSEQNTGLGNRDIKNISKIENNNIYDSKIPKISGAQENHPLQPKHNNQSMSELQSNKGNASVKDKLKYFDQLIGDDFDFVPKTDSKLPDLVNKHSIAKPPTVVKQKLEFFDNLLGKNDLSFKNNSFSNRNPQNFVCSSSTSGKSLQLSDIALKKTNTTLEDTLETQPNSSFKTPIKGLGNSSAKKTKRKLGVSSLRQISIPESKLQKARLIFDEEFTGISPIKPLLQTSNTIENSCSTPIKRDIEKHESFMDFRETVSKEPGITETEQSVIQTVFNLKEDCQVTFNIPENKNLNEVIVDFSAEARKLEQKLIVLNKRKEILESFRKDKADCDKRPKVGMLLKSKSQSNRILLRSFVKGLQPGGNCDSNFNCITPQNAADIHFKESSAVILTEDEATVVPNINNLIGVAEIENAFKAMPGTDPRLIPKGWIKNHYKWIIWKLSSYERMFPDQFKGSLTVEHVIQQLKYRYDREIDKVERSALRKILERDDVPQKRMVLCVSGVKKVGFNSHELELTDGWYGIRTVIDEHLNQQIFAGKIKIGTKLVTCGAELMNCDGCHPLDVTDLTFLKICFNCTRRTKWDVKLGYQRFPGPFSVPIHSVRPGGGAIGRIDVYVVRSYPFRYLDKSEVKCVWRNKKAEERRAQAWENERYKKLELIEENIRNDYRSISNPEKFNKNCDISGINCPITLLEIIETSNDPETMEAKLSSSQKSSLLNYKQNLLQQKQQEMAAKLKNSAEKLKMSKRDVVAVMKLLVVDQKGSPTKTYNFYVWNATDNHLQLLKEESCLAVFNVYPKITGDLNSGVKTTFESKPNTKYGNDLFKRKLLTIEDLLSWNFSSHFNEFDTVGIVVQLFVENATQEIWLCDILARLLLIKISEGPSTCLLVDGLKRGQLISVCNLTYRGTSNEILVSKASANQFTIFSSYPKYKHLQNGLDDLKNKLPKKIDDLLKDCDNRIDKFKHRNSTSIFDESDEDITLTSSKITSTDVALSLIDFDKFT
ncbi:uncharacterized protein [Diabrotica undecimpunctata]|uniref:uncharacterized protein n=1 Tax=Diabrotica undecimpunctata TaxID=50387 RepID=UPI003B6398BA